MRGMPSVVTLRTCVSPRWKRPEPWAVSSTPTCDDSGRMSAGPRPSMRMPSSTMRLRTTALLAERTAALIWPAAFGTSSKRGVSSARSSAVAESVASLRSALLLIAYALDRRSAPASKTAS